MPAPTPGTLTMREAMYYTLSRPVSTVIIGCDSIAQLEENVQTGAGVYAAERPRRRRNWWRAAEPVAKPSLFFRFYDRP